tara:strand:- start:140 stop:358 length:219 start_codon:yes stop_codon:yes gene_type:complete
MRAFQILNDAIGAEVFSNKSLLKSATEIARSNIHKAILAYGRNQTLKGASKLPTNQAMVQMVSTPSTEIDFS